MTDVKQPEPDIDPATSRFIANTLLGVKTGEEATAAANTIQAAVLTIAMVRREVNAINSNIDTYKNKLAVQQDKCAHQITSRYDLDGKGVTVCRVCDKKLSVS